MTDAEKNPRRYVLLEKMRAEPDGRRNGGAGKRSWKDSSGLGPDGLTPLSRFVLYSAGNRITGNYSKTLGLFLFLF